MVKIMLFSKKVIVKFHMSYRDFPVINYDYNGRTICTYNRINPRDGGIPFENGFFEKNETILKEQQIESINSILQKIDLKQWRNEGCVQSTALHIPAGYIRGCYFNCTLSDGKNESYEFRNDIPKTFKELSALLESICKPPEYKTNNLKQNVHTEFEFVERQKRQTGITEMLFSNTIPLYNVKEKRFLNITKNRITVGREKYNDIIIENKYISRNHAEFRYVNNRWFVKDNNSTEGTTVNGEKLIPEKYYLLYKDDVLEFAGEEKYIFGNNEKQNEIDSPFSAPQVNGNGLKKDDFIGKTIGGRYRIIDRLFCGVISRTYRAVDNKTNLSVAISVTDKYDDLCEIQGDKIINNNDIVSNANLLEKLNYPMLQKVYYIEENEKYIAIVKEYLCGEKLSDFVEKADDTFIVNTAEKLCGLLEYLHGQNPPIIHGLIEADNIDGSMKLPEIRNQFKGFAHYDGCVLLPPNQYNAPEIHSGFFNEQTDIFSMGMVLYFLSSGIDPSEPPYEIKPISDVNKSISKKLVKIINKCIEPNPVNRYINIQEVIKDLKKVKSNQFIRFKRR